mmetsp:Transcript_44224/g.144900  ORF Transcript_44224/g.144900 Transcript_44224/m.144900 type:complete len:359 (-) Transcript_44224:1481-2557(-)
MTTLLAYADYWATGEADLAAAYMPLLVHNLRLQDRDGTGLLNCSAVTRGGCAAGRAGQGHHIVDWRPAPNRSMFAFSEHLSVTQAFALAGLGRLGSLAELLNRSALAASLAGEAAALRASMEARMWDGNGTGRWCDGACSEVGWRSGVTTSAWMLWLGLLPAASVPAAWSQLAGWGLEGFGDYGAFVFLGALAAFDGDDGSALLRALTKCDAQSWCAMMRDYNATMTREGLYGAGGTSSHPWGTAPLAGVAGGVVGVSQTSPGFATFSVRPRLARLTHATLRVPTLHGFIDVHATPNETRVAPPCGTTATVCVRDGSAPRRLLLDGSPAAAQVADGRHRCAVGVGCGAGGRARRVSLE